jgi:uncharacterized protein (DUF1778 family)
MTRKLRDGEEAMVERIYVRVTDREKKAIRKCARQLGMSVSDLTREALFTKHGKLP